jgi:hypothetical protein
MAQTMSLGINGFDTSVGTHICGFYHGRDELDSVLYPYLQAGVRDGEKTVCLIDSQRPEEVLDSLRSGVNVEAALAAQQLEVKHSSESYLASGSFRMRDWIDELRTLSSDSVEVQGFPRMRAVGEMSWALKNFPGSEDLFEYEAEVNRFVGSYQVLYFCLYDVDTVSGSMVMDAIKTHPQVLIGGCLFENPYYMEPEHFLGKSACCSSSN